jgi:protein-S-isoprenylcysteine O-methyltransferase Ste14
MNRTLIGKLFYGSLFIVVLPALLVLWAKASDPSVPLPVPLAPSTGIAISLAGALLLLAGMVSLMVLGHGLPMNAYPPSNFVGEGIYGVLSHPIYVGFSILCIGAAIAGGSPAGLWLVSPVVILGCAALVLGFEHRDLRQRFGNKIVLPLVHIPPDANAPPSSGDRLSVYLLVLIPWLVLYEAIRALGVPADAVVAYFPFELHLPVYEWTEVVYLSTYVFVCLVPILVRSQRDLREFSLAGLSATVLIMLLYVSVPIIAPQRSFTPQGILGHLLMVEREYDTPANALPSFHVVWAFLAARAYAGSFRRVRLLLWLWASLISVSCMTTGMHSLVDVLAGLIVTILVLRRHAVWEWIRALAERIANSWKEWRVGPVRIINHGAYAALGTFVGLSIVGTLLGTAYVVPMLTVGFVAMVSAALWAQIIEGSPSLLRPYGYYGGVLGVLLGCLLAQLAGGDFWLLAAAYAVAAPWIQSGGRLRCLVQGCCHGAEASPVVGIRYSHPRSRVCKLAGLTGIPIHPTPVYSILWNIPSGIILARLWFLHASPPLIAGLYLILNGVGRFVEESRRGEPQTPVVGKLRLYQWNSIVSLIIGACFTALGPGIPVPDPQFNFPSIVAALFFGACTWFALGVDFPNSNRRFARLV